MFGLPGGLGPGTFITYAKGYDVELTLDEAIPLCNLWKNTFPETIEYLKNPGPELDETAPEILPSDSDQVRKIKSIYRYKCVNLNGRRRSRCSYTQACNTGFQSLAADCTKNAMWNLWKAGYFMENMIHDETITLLPLDWDLTSRAEHIQRIMVESMRELTPDVKVKAEPALMFRWAKSAEPYYADRLLIPWECVPKHLVKGKLKPADWKDLPEPTRTKFMDGFKRMVDMAEKARRGVCLT